MFWNYRLVEGEDGTLGIHEVYYDDRAQPEFCTANPVELGGWDSITELADTLEYINKAFSKPVLHIEDF